jgi:hypothetical protein
MSALRFSALARPATNAMGTVANCGLTVDRWQLAAGNW